MFDETEIDRDDGGRGALEAWGIKATAVYLILFLGGIPVAAYFDLLRLTPLTLNELGDFFAGAFGPLAIFWVVLGFFQQGKELRNSVDTLKIQARELSFSVEQQKQLVAATREAVEYEKGFARSQEEKRKNSIQPEFIAEFRTSVRYGTEQAKYKFTIKNAGAPCTRLSFELWHRSKSILHRTVDLFSYEKSMDFDLFSGEKVDEIKDDLKLLVAYLDKDLEQMQCEFDITYDHSTSGFAPHVTSLKERISIGG